MSEDEAQRRCRAARLARRFPILLEMLAEASLHLTGILLIGPHLTNENCAELLARARFRTKREIERLVAEIAPCHDVPSRIVPLCRAGAADWMLSPLGDDKPGLLAWSRNNGAAYVQALAGEVRELQAGLGAGQAPPRTADGPIAAPTAMDEGREAKRDASTAMCSGAARPAAAAQPVAQLRYKVQFTADQAYVDLLEEARNLLQHELPTRDLVAVQRRALEALVHKLRQRKYAASKRPRAKSSKPVNRTPQPPLQPGSNGPPARRPATRALHSRPPSTAEVRHSAPATQSANHSRYIPAHVRRSVWQRDEARCAYVDARGQRCREQSGLEFHHQHPHARGGPPDVDNLALRCRAHNALAAEQDFGRDVMWKKRARRPTLVGPDRAGAAP